MNKIGPNIMTTSTKWKDFLIEGNLLLRKVTENKENANTSQNKNSSFGGQCIEKFSEQKSIFDIKKTRPNTVNMLGEKLRELREAKGLVKRQVADDLELDTTYICKMESN